MGTPLISCLLPLDHFRQAYLSHHPVHSSTTLSSTLLLELLLTASLLLLVITHKPVQPHWAHLRRKRFLTGLLDMDSMPVLQVGRYRVSLTIHRKPGKGRITLPMRSLPNMLLPRLEIGC